MENASKALLIAGAILLAILIIAIGMFIYTSAQSTVNNSMTSMTTQEIDAFNNQFISYEQAQTGSNIKAMIGRLVANAKTYAEEPNKIPNVYYTKGSGSLGDNTYCVSTTGDEVNSYVDGLGKLRNGIESKHEYWVLVETDNTTSLVKHITINYDSNNHDSSKPTT